MGFNALFGGDLHMRKWMIVLLIAALAMSLWAVVLAEEAEIWANVSAEEVEDAVGVGLGVPDGAESVCYSLLADENLAEVSFTWYDLEYVARVKPAEAFEDLSGLDIDRWDQTVEFDISGCPCTDSRVRTGDEVLELCQWYDAENGLMYCIFTSDVDLDGFDITAAASAVYAPALATA